MPTADEWDGVNTLIDAYLQPGPDDRFLLVHGSAAVHETSWLKVALKTRGYAVSTVWTIPLRDPEFESRLLEKLPETPGNGRLVIIVLEQETLSHDEVLQHALARFPTGSVKLFRAITANGLLFSHGLSVGPDELSRRNTALLERLMPASQIRVVSDAGTDLQIVFDPKYRWVSNRGMWGPGRTVILPPGEVATYPRDISGVFVADFAINVNIHTDVDVRLDRSPVRVMIENGKLAEFQCDDSGTRRFLEQCFEGACARRVGEVGFGTNFGITAPVNVNSHLNERHPGLHLGFGESNQPPELVGYDCHIHVDLISTGGKVVFEDSTRLDLSDYAPSANPHPGETRDEDAFSTDGSGGLAPTDDCCGMLKASMIES